jgi:hypothetical protein
MISDHMKKEIEIINREIDQQEKNIALVKDNLVKYI